MLVIGAGEDGTTDMRTDDIVFFVLVRGLGLQTKRKWSLACEPLAYMKQREGWSQTSPKM